MLWSVSPVRNIACHDAKRVGKAMSSAGHQAPPLEVLSRKHARPRLRLSLSLPDTLAMADLNLATLTHEQLDRLVRQLDDSALEIATLTAKRDSACQQSTVNAPAPTQASTNAPAQSNEPIVISSGTPSHHDSVGQRSGAQLMPGMERNRAAPSTSGPREAHRHVEFAATSGNDNIVVPMPLKPQRPSGFTPRSSSPMQAVALDSSVVGGGDSGGAGSGGAGSGGADSGGAGSGGAGSGGADPEGVVSGVAERPTGGGVEGSIVGGSAGSEGAGAGGTRAGGARGSCAGGSGARGYGAAGARGSGAGGTRAGGAGGTGAGGAGGTGAGGLHLRLLSADPSLFLCVDITLPPFYILVYVDDLVVATADSEGYTFSLDTGSVSWRSTRSSYVLGSSCEAKIYAGAMAAQELRWLTYLLTDLGERPHSPVLYVDNNAIIALCREQRLEHITKHIFLRYFLVRESQQRGQLRLSYVASQANTADIFTKALGSGDHQRFCTALGLAPTLPHLLVS
ncbi:unnamed protein product [Closterium sp. NIES-54]